MTFQGADAAIFDERMIIFEATPGFHAAEGIQKPELCQAAVNCVAGRMLVETVLSMRRWSAHWQKGDATRSGRIFTPRLAYTIGAVNVAPSQWALASSQRVCFVALSSAEFSCKNQYHWLVLY